MLAKCFEVSDTVIIGVSSDAFALKRGKQLDQTITQRVQALEAYINATYPNKSFVISVLDDYFGPGIANPEVEAIVVTPETATTVEKINEFRKSHGATPLKVEIASFVLAEDGALISSTRIRRGEITPDGKLVKKT